MVLSPSPGRQRWGTPVSRAGLLLVLVLPLWALWIYAYVGLRDLRGGIDMLPRFYGMHLRRQEVQQRLELFAQVVARLDRETGKTAPEWLGVRSVEEVVDEMAGLFGLEQPLLMVQQEGLEIRYPSSPQGPLAVILQDPGCRKALLHVLGRMTAGGLREAFCSLGPGGPSPAVAARWYLVTACRGDGFLWVLMMPERTVDLAGSHLQAAQQALVEEGLDRFLTVTLPAVILASLLIGLVCWRLPSSRKERSEESLHGKNGAETSPPAGP